MKIFILVSQLSVNIRPYTSGIQVIYDAFGFTCFVRDLVLLTLSMLRTRDHS